MYKSLFHWNAFCGAASRCAEPLKATNYLALALYHDVSNSYLFTNLILPSNPFIFKNLLNTWEGTISEEKLVKLIGPDRMEKLFTELGKNIDTLNENEKKDLKNIFKDSLTFD